MEILFSGRVITFDNDSDKPRVLTYPPLPRCGIVFFFFYIILIFILAPAATVAAAVVVDVFRTIVGNYAPLSDERAPSADVQKYRKSGPEQLIVRVRFKCEQKIFSQHGSRDSRGFPPITSGSRFVVIIFFFFCFRTNNGDN